MNRRTFLRNSLAFSAASLTASRVFAAPPTLGHAEPGSGELPAFPAGFLFGAATSCVQIEGAADEDGKGESIWDRFVRVPGAVKDGSTADLACDSYHRWPQDIDLLKRMGLQSFRMSIAWPRILPQGRGAVNMKGIDHYNRIIDALLKAGVQPLVTAYHWDLPQVLEDAGGWPNRDTAFRLADYAGVLARHFGDRVERWCLMNELQAFTVCGYGWGVHAPGKKDRNLMLRAAHTANLAQGLGFRAMKAQRSSLKIGIAHDLYPVHPATGSEADRKACERFDAFRNRWFLDPPFTGQYPEAFLAGVPYEAMGYKVGDEKLMRAPLDYSGINYYAGLGIVGAGDDTELLKGLDAHEMRNRRQDFYANGMHEFMLDIAHRYQRPIIITETGYDEPDVVAPDGEVHDPKRIEYLRTILTSLRRAMLEGADVRSIHVWSLIDDWEWNDGFGAHIGLAYVDFKNPKERILKDSGYWYGEVARARKLPASPAALSAR